jgi:hypothetical protein
MMERVEMKTASSPIAKDKKGVFVRKEVKYAEVSPQLKY